MRAENCAELFGISEAESFWERPTFADARSITFADLFFQLELQPCGKIVNRFHDALLLSNAHPWTMSDGSFSEARSLVCS